MPEQPIFNSGIRDNREYFIEIVENSNLLIMRVKSQK